jgi:excisionase family DNA binding protein
MKLRSTQFGVRENTASPKQHAPRLAEDSIASSPKTLLRSSHHGDLSTSPAFITTEEEDTLIAKPLDAATGRESEEGSNDSNPQPRKQVISVGRAPTFELLVGCDEAARLLGNIHVKTLQRYARQGTVPGYRIGGHWYFRVTELDEWLRSRINSNCQSVR